MSRKWSGVEARARMRRQGAYSPSTGQGFTPGAVPVPTTTSKAEQRAEADKGKAEIAPIVKAAPEPIAFGSRQHDPLDSRHRATPDPV